MIILLPLDQFGFKESSDFIFYLYREISHNILLWNPKKVVLWIKKVVFFLQETFV